MKNLTRQEQLILGIEQLGLARKLVFVKEGINSIRLIEILEQMQVENPNDLFLEDREIPERKYNNYRKILQEEFGVILNFKKGWVQNFEEDLDKIIKICSTYFQTICHRQNDISIKLFVKNRASQEIKETYADALSYLVAFKYAIRFGLKLEFKYSKFMNQEISRRRVIPYALSIQNEYIDLIAYDVNDGIIKQFIINCISELNWNFYSEFIQFKNKSKFNLEEYKKSDLGNFYREKVDYKISFSEFSFRHFVNTYDIDYEILENIDQKVFCRVSTSDWHLIQKILFQYNLYAKLLSPLLKVQEFQWMIQSLQKIYE
jgi:hypothetical protein